MSNDTLKQEIKKLIITTLSIDEVEPSSIEDDNPLFEQGNPLGLDSIDALELVMALQEKYGVRLDNKNQSRFILRTVSSIAEFIEKQRVK